MLAAAGTPEIMWALLKHRPVCRISSNILAAAGSQGNNGRELMQLLFDHEADIQITDTVMIAALNSNRLSYRYEVDLKRLELTERLVELLFERNIDLEVTDAMLKAANTPNDLQVLLKRAPNMRVTEDLLLAAASKLSGHALVKLLLDHDKTVKTHVAVLFCHLSMIDNDYTAFMTTLLEHDPELHIPSDAFADLVKLTTPFERMQLAELLLKYEKKVDFTEEVRTAIDQQFQGYRYKDAKALFYKLERK